MPFFSKGQHKPEILFAKIIELLREIPPRPLIGKPDKAAVWVKNGKGIVAVTCTDCLSTFPIEAIYGINTAECEFWSCNIRFEIIGS